MIQNSIQAKEVSGERFLGAINSAVRELNVMPGKDGARGNEVAWHSPQSGNFTLLSTRTTAYGVAVVHAARYTARLNEKEDKVFGLPTEGGHIAEWQHVAGDAIEGSFVEYGVGVTPKEAAIHMLCDLTDPEGQIVPIEMIRGPERPPARDVRLTPRNNKPQPVSPRSAGRPYIAVAAR